AGWAERAASSAADAVLRLSTASAPRTASSADSASGSEPRGTGSQARTSTPAATRSPAIAPPASPTPRIAIRVTTDGPGRRLARRLGGESAVPSLDRLSPKPGGTPRVERLHLRPGQAGHVRLDGEAVLRLEVREVPVARREALEQVAIELQVRRGVDGVE